MDKFTFIWIFVLEEAFAAVDADNDGLISKEEAMELADLLDIDPTDIEAMFNDEKTQTSLADVLTFVSSVA